MHIVLIEPEIPQNTGNIARTCALTRSCLHLVKPLGFSIEDRYLKRAGLDYWDKVEVKIWDDFTQLLNAYPYQRKFFATTRTVQYYHQVQFQSDDMLVFGPESRGLPAELLELYVNHLVRIPMLDIGRSLNLSNAVAIIVYEALRQMEFLELL
ncbi:MAG: tRNA (cytidine(34)-2'-O)-methyltransferase [Syntrophomonadaceae bacterium]|nr:tRNA (cytidine(34)-2'-O)-methyltransferase [Syntrophomonadaceae bacterium]